MAGEISFTPSPEDYLAANRDWFRAMLGRRRYWITLAGGFSIGFLFGGVVALPNDAPEVVGSGIVFGLGVLFVVGLLTAISWAMLPRRTRRMYGQQKSLSRPWHYRWSEEALELNTIHAAVRVPWPDLYRWSDGRRALLFFNSEQTFYFIPLRVLTAEQADDLRSIASKGVERRL